MAKVLCIPSDILTKLKVALKTGTIDMNSLFEKNSSEERRAVWEPVVGEDVAKFINTKWEKAAASDTRNAMLNFAKEITAEKDAPKRANLLTKIRALEDAGVLDADSITATFTDLVSDRLGVSVTESEIKTLHEKAQAIEKLQGKLVDAEAAGDKFGKDEAKKWRGTIQPARIALHKATTDMDKFMNSLAPTHKGAVITGSIFRGNMLLNIPVATINNISNLVQGTVQALERRMALRQLTGSNNAYAIEYAKMIVRVFHETGYDMSREYAEDIRLGEHLVHNEGPGILRKVARGQAKIVFKYILGYSDVVSAAAARADSANVGAAKIAGMKKGLSAEQQQDYALQVFKQQTKSTKDLSIEAGKDGLFVHNQAIADAERATWTNKGIIAEKSLKFRDWLNDATGDLNLGFWNIPFVKTGANVIQFGIESSPIGFMTGGVQLAKAIRAQNNSSLTIERKQELMREATRLMWRAGLGSVASAILVGLLDPDDFFSAYDSVTQAQRDQMGLKKGVYNAVKIGGVWVSLDFFGPLGATIVGMMYAKKYGEGPADTVFKFAQGVGQQTLQIPGMDSFEDLVETWRDILTAESLGEGAKGIAISTINTIRSRAIPGILGTLAKATDTKVRKIDRKDLLGRVKAGIPGLRQTLPPKIDITTGREVKGEGFWITLLFGSRVKTANESRLITEITRLDSQGQAPAIADIVRSSKLVQQFKAQKPEAVFLAALKFFGREYGQRATRAIQKTDYRRASDEDRKKILNKIRTEVRAEMLRKFKFRKPKKGRKRFS